MGASHSSLSRTPPPRVPRKLVVVGAVAGGASFAARMRRLDEHAHILLFEKGPDPSFGTPRLPFAECRGS